MIALGALIGFLIALRFEAAELTDKLTLIKAVIAHLLFIPINFMQSTGIDVYFPLNSPHWSLLFEALAYGLYVQALRQAGSLVLAVLICFCAGILLQIGLYANYTSESVLWVTLACLARVLLSFCFGMLIKRAWRAGYLPNLRLHPVLLCFMLCLPMLPSEPGLSNAAAVAVIMLVFPCILIMAITCKVPQSWVSFCQFLGAISYPFYAIHRPLMPLFLAGLHGLFGASLGLFTQGLGVFVLCGVAALTGLKWIDTPLRQYWTQNWLKAKPVISKNNSG